MPQGPCNGTDQYLHNSTLVKGKNLEMFYFKGETGTPGGVPSQGEEGSDHQADQPCEGSQ